jgi:3-deoxy-D-manno-octulosonate 8-phosphate phosphatase (KDO 8-P phosphatase)
VLEIGAIERLFSERGASFLSSAEALSAKLESIRAFVFDWDGVFNTGAKGAGHASSFAEADSMGTNLVRYAHWRMHAELPVTAIVTGADNPSAVQFAEREHFSVVYARLTDKSKVLIALRERYGIDAGQIAYVFDDVNDLAVAAHAGLRFLVRRDASPLLQEYVARRGLCDYITAAEGGRYAVREVAELLLGILQCYDDVVTSRLDWDADYARYFAARQAADTEVVASA